MNENYLLDTDILISYLRGYPDTIELTYWEHFWERSSLIIS